MLGIETGAWVPWGTMAVVVKDDCSALKLMRRLSGEFPIKVEPEGRHVLISPFPTVSDDRKHQLLQEAGLCALT